MAPLDGMSFRAIRDACVTAAQKRQVFAEACSDPMLNLSVPDEFEDAQLQEDTIRREFSRPRSSAGGLPMAGASPAWMLRTPMGMALAALPDLPTGDLDVLSCRWETEEHKRAASMHGNETHTLKVEAVPDSLSKWIQNEDAEKLRSWLRTERALEVWKEEADNFVNQGRKSPNGNKPCAPFGARFQAMQISPDPLEQDTSSTSSSSHARTNEQVTKTSDAEISIYAEMEISRTQAALRTHQADLLIERLTTREFDELEVPDVEDFPQKPHRHPPVTVPIVGGPELSPDMSPPSDRTIPDEKVVNVVQGPGLKSMKELLMEGDGFFGPVSCGIGIHSFDMCLPPESPPVVGRNVGQSTDTAASLHVCGLNGLSGPSSVSVPRLQRIAVAAASARAPWPTEAEARPGAKAQAAEAASQEAPSVFSFLRSHFADVDVDHNRQVSDRELVAFIVARTRWRNEVSSGTEQLLRATAVRCYQQAVLREGEIRVEDWVHYGLMLLSAPSTLAHHLLNERLRRELGRNPFLLKEILRVFEEVDVRGAGRLRARDLKSLIVDGDAVLRTMCLDEACEIDYYQFVAYCLGCRPSQVQLNWYDLSRGYAQWVPPTVLGGQQLSGIWHTGVVVFGKEYWYGGKVLSSCPGQTPFPPGPVRTTHLGSTLRTCEEFEDFLRFELAPRYTRERYDVLWHNCNHFSDEAAAFLIQGAHLPDEARRQPEAVLSAPLLQTLRPYLNVWLGGFEATEGGGDHEIDDLMTEWRARLWPGDFALYVVHREHHEPVQLVQVSNVDASKGVCDIVYFTSDGAAANATITEMASKESTGVSAIPSGPSSIRAAVQAHCLVSREHTSDVQGLRLGSCVLSGSFWDWRAVRRPAVPLSALRPHTLRGRGLGGTFGSGLGHHLLRTQVRATNPEIQTHLLRKANVNAHCPQGHSMHPARGRRSWDLVAKDLRCGICNQVLPQADDRLECTPCSFYLCGSCDQKAHSRGYYSLGCIDKYTVEMLITEPEWVRYKAQRYLAAANAHQGKLEPDIWRMKVAPRVFGDLGMDLPSRTELMELHARFHKDCSKDWRGLDVDEFKDLMMELLTIELRVISL